MAVCIFSGLLIWRLKNTPYFVSHQKSLKHLRTNTPQTTTYTFLKITGLLLATKFVVAALFGGDDGVYDPEELLFLGTMHGLAYEPYFRGVLLLSLLHALENNQPKWKMPKVFIGLPYLATTLLFALQISLSFSGGYWQFYPLSFLTMLIYGSMLCWLKVRTNNLLLVILAHNAAVLFSQFLQMFWESLYKRVITLRIKICREFIHKAVHI
ncbi:type II CAAX prenyl endopeptidase Rce1 family protein [Thalassotalea euphylliae]|uniref:CPBP family glutamic-type intramembrane protease n=1 Tax=Thalassotalea euphylliae TaxID=1655234 RepID=UPI003641BE37